MKPHFFLLYTLLAAGGLLLAFLPSRKAEPEAPGGGWRRKALYVVSALLLLPLAAKGSFALFPRFEATWMPVRGYASVQREFFLPLSVFFFAAAGRLVPPGRRTFTLVLTAFFAVFTVYEVSWHLFRPVAYDLDFKAGENGVCRQSSRYTCGAASMVMLLHRMGIDSTEGEMAELSETIPRKGASHHQVAMGLQRKLARLGRKEKVRLETPAGKKLGGLKPPFLAGMPYNLLIDHMVCVLHVNEKYVTYGDPAQGILAWEREHFEEAWYGIAVTVEGREGSTP